MSFRSCSVAPPSAHQGSNPFHRYLLPNEQLLWVGRPRQGVTLRGSAWYDIPLSLAWNGNILRYFSLVTTVGMPQSTAAQELRLECLFPADEATESGHVQMLGEEPALIGRR